MHLIVVFGLVWSAVGQDVQLTDQEIEGMAPRVRDYPTKFQLIRLGARAVRPLMAQVTHENPWVAFESQSALRYIAQHAAKDPGGGQVVEALKPYTAGDVPRQQRVFVCELLGELGTGHDVTEVLSGMVHQEDVLPAVIDALARVRDSKAAAVLARLSGQAPRVLRPAALLALGRRKDPSNVRANYLRVLQEAVKEADATLAAAAVEALGMTGDEAVLPALIEALKSDRLQPQAHAALLSVGFSLLPAHPEAAKQAFQAAYDAARGDEQVAAALLALGTAGHCREAEQHLQNKSELVAAAAARAMATAGDVLMAAGRHKEAAEAYRKVLQRPRDEGAVIRALIASGRIGAEGTADTIAAFLKHESTRVRTAAIQALKDLKGEAATKAIAAHLEAAQGLDLVALIGALGARRDAAAVPALGRLAGHKDRTVALAAIRALADIGDVSAEPALWEVVEGAADSIARIAGDAYVDLAERCGHPDKAREMYHKVLGVSLLRSTTLQRALTGLAKVADADSIPVLERFISGSEGANRETALKTYVAAGDTLAAAGRRAEAAAVYKKAADWGVPGLEGKLRALGEKVEMTAQEGRIDTWWVIGPFAAEDQNAWTRAEFPEKEVDLTKTYEVQGRKLGWRSVTGRTEDGYVDLDAELSPNEYVAAYAYAEIVTRKEGEAVLKCGSDDGIFVWVNGQKVHANATLRGFEPGQDTVKIKLKEGVNTILVKVCEQEGEWGFGVRLEGPDGKPLRFKIR